MSSEATSKPGELSETPKADETERPGEPETPAKARGKAGAKAKAKGKAKAAASVPDESAGLVKSRDAAEVEVTLKVNETAKPGDPSPAEPAEPLKVEDKDQARSGGVELPILQEKMGSEERAKPSEMSETTEAGEPDTPANAGGKATVEVKGKAKRKAIVAEAEHIDQVAASTDTTEPSVKAAKLAHASDAVAGDATQSRGNWARSKRYQTTGNNG